MAPVRAEAVRLAGMAGLDDDGQADVSLAVTEACANAVVHAYVGREPGKITVTAEITGRGLEVHVVDFGRGMAPRSDSPGLGLGLPLMVSLTSDVEFRTAPGGGTEIWMLFATDGEPAHMAWGRTG
ncbi:MAG: ATP-binding protein [Solirubrobacterales bacterium]|nr:ATP-binding protein [Solirubrobacterales bacterium]